MKNPVERLRYTAPSDRPRHSLPGGQKLILWPVVNIENWLIENPMPRQVLVDADGQEIPFTVDGFRKHCLLEGLDDIGLTLQQEGAIASYEARVRQQQPWVIGA